METERLTNEVKVAVFETMIKKATSKDGGLDAEAVVNGVADALGAFMVQLAEQSDEDVEDLAAAFDNRLVAVRTEK